MFEVGDIVTSVYDNKWRAKLTRIVNNGVTTYADGITITTNPMRFQLAEVSQFILIKKPIKRNLPEWW
jgi:hypothetical protein